MGPTAPPRTWDESSSPAATRLARRYEAAWQASSRADRPDPAAFLADEPDATAAAHLAVLRADLNLRWEADGPLRVEHYRDRDPGLDAETLVALIYEEFCLREDDGDAPVPAEYEERFPDLVDRLRRVFDIHDLVGNATSMTALQPSGPPAVPFPEAGQTIAGFHLVEELGRGAFARVFLARERQLADRPVALKVARKGSREPQTLARLQHTHIVPVHSYRDDPATGLHLLCMPYFGRVTLEQLLDDPASRIAPTGAALLATLDRLEPGDATAEESAARAALSTLPYARAVAWWGARLAEALAHAHDRGVLHRDIKPSNVLVTGDGLPMLLDFNLAGETWADHAAKGAETLGGTVAYMAPEHLDALAENDPGGIDRRSDLYSLGVLLYEAVAGSRPFPPPANGPSVPDTLHRAAEARRGPAPRLREEHPEVPASLERVIRRCLAPDPAQRHRTAGELAADLQAVADDAPLPWTREPLAVRMGRRAWRARKRLALAVPLVLALVALAITSIRARDERGRVGEIVRHKLADGVQWMAREEYQRADASFETVEQLTRGQPTLARQFQDARAHRALARQTGEVRSRADALARAASGLRRRLIGPADAGPEVEALLRPFDVQAEPVWSRSADLDQLDGPRRDRLVRDVDEVLFLYAASLDPGDEAEARRSVALCDRALKFTPAAGPWRALKAWYAEAPADDAGTAPSQETSATACYEWAVLRDRQKRPDRAIEWLERASWLDPGNAWYHHHLAILAARADRPELASRHFEAAIAIDPGSRAIRLDRAALLRSIGQADRAELDQLRAEGPGPERSR
ncbi:protein kinase domain-containing protein [Tundrisphaera sp. TA3]|uniref:serine/threonine-protein kinase n=1 Tax=Tundrisphaera sp. TA3 TaxID=3435775 RepID=UPI003EB79959